MSSPPTRRPAGFTLVELLLAVALGSMLMIGVVYSTQMFSAGAEELKAEASSEAEQTLALVTGEVRQGWWVEAPSATRLEVGDPYGNETAYFLDGDELKVRRPDGDEGVLLEDVASVDFTVGTTQRLRDDAPLDQYGVYSSHAEPAGTPEVLSLVSGDSLGLSFTVPRDAPDGVDTVSGVAEELIEASVDRLIANMSYVAGEPRKISPVLECMWDNGDGTHTGHFGYNNPNPFIVTVPIGPDNRFSPAPQDRGQPTVFHPGRHRFVFTVDFVSGNQVWILTKKTSTVNENSKACSAPGEY